MKKIEVLHSYWEINWNVLRWHCSGGVVVEVVVVEVVTSSDMRGDGDPPSPYNCLHSLLGTTGQTDLSLTTGLYDAGVSIPDWSLGNMCLLSHFPQHQQLSGKSRYCWWRFTQVWNVFEPSLILVSYAAVGFFQEFFKLWEVMWFYNNTYRSSIKKYIFSKILYQSSLSPQNPWK